METELSNQLLALAGAFRAKRGLEESTLGRLCAADSRFFQRLREGRTTFTVKKYDEIVAWFDGNWPDGSKWPVAIARPTRQNTAA